MLNCSGSFPVENHRCTNHARNAGVRCTGKCTFLVTIFPIRDAHTYSVQCVRTAQMVRFDWWVVRLNWREELRSVLMECGGQCVDASGTLVLPLSSVDSLDSPLKVELMLGFV